MSILSKKYFQTEAAAFDHLEAVLWADGVVCPHCGTVDKAGKLNGVKSKTGKVRLGLWKCYSAGCRKQFTVKVGTVFESAHIPLHKMLQAVHLICSSKKGFSAHQLHRTLEVDYKSAWFLAHRIREAMRDGKLAPMGGGGAIVEIDETYIGRLEGQPKGRGGASSYKNTVLTLVERGGSARSFHVDSTTLADIIPVVTASVAREAWMMTDEASWYRWIGKEYEGHDAVNHGQKEYVRRDGDRVIHTNTVEGYYSIFKRGMKGTYQHCKEKHLHRYLAEFDFRYSHRIARGVDDQERAERALKGIAGKRLTYKDPRHIAAN